MDPFFSTDGDDFVPSVSTRGPWDERFQHGGPPSALMLHVMNRAMSAHDGFVVARMTAEFLRPVPLEPLRVEVDAPEGGRRVKRVRVRLVADVPVMAATAVYVKTTEGLAYEALTRDGHVDAEWPAPSEAEPFEFPFFSTEGGYDQAVEVRVVDAPWGTTPIRCWARPRVPLIAGIETTPEEAVVIMADAESGMGPPVDPHTFSYANPDLTVYFGRRPRAGWVGLDIRSRADGVGIGLSESSLRDEDGVFGRSAQSLILAPR